MSILTPARALAYLESLPAGSVIELPGEDETGGPEAGAVEIVSGIRAQDFAVRYGCWQWGRDQLVSTLRNGWGGSTTGYLHQVIRDTVSEIILDALESGRDVRAEIELLRRDVVSGWAAGVEGAGGDLGAWRLNA